ncbi:hypothetical protein ABIA39_008926 [Nocardia sp. GAS34]|uniref:hypothetical protein n=1 Tax=unclassified Nocardia TaxID=2637762 RepID=UPI003D20384D
MKRDEHQYLVRYVKHQGYWDVLVPAINRWTTVRDADQIAATAREMLTEQGAQKFGVTIEPTAAAGPQACDGTDHDGLTRWHPPLRQDRLPHRPQPRRC